MRETVIFTCYRNLVQFCSYSSAVVTDRNSIFVRPTSRTFTQFRYDELVRCLLQRSVWCGNLRQVFGAISTASATYLMCVLTPKLAG